MPPQLFPKAASQKRPDFGCKKHFVVRSGAFLELSPAPAGPAELALPPPGGCCSRDPAVQRGLANEPGCNRAVALMHSACIVSCL